MMRCTYCKEEIPAAGEGWPYRGGRHIWFCCAECKAGWHNEQKKKRGKIDPNYPTYDDEEEDVPMEEVKTAPAAPAEEQEESMPDKTADELATMRSRLESMSMDAEINQKIMREMEDEIAKLKYKNDTLRRMLRDAMTLVED